MIGFKYSAQSQNSSLVEMLRKAVSGIIAAQTINEESAYDTMPKSFRDNVIEATANQFAGEIDAYCKGVVERFAEDYTPPTDDEQQTVTPEV